jgi:hypothetical protein
VGRSLRRLPTRPKQPGASKGTTTSFTPRLRYSGFSLGFHLASITAGGPAPLIATALLAATGSGYVIALYILFCVVVTIASTIFLPDHTNRDISKEEAYGAAARHAGRNLNIGVRAACCCVSSDWANSARGTRRRVESLYYDYIRSQKTEVQSMLNRIAAMPEVLNQPADE